MGLISRVSSRTYRNIKTWTSTMKTVNCNYDVDLSKFGDAVKMTVKGQVVTVSGPRGTLKRDFSHLKVELKKTGPQAPNHQVVGHHETKSCSPNCQLSHQQHGHWSHRRFPIQNANRLRAFPNQHDCERRWRPSRDPKFPRRKD